MVDAESPQRREVTQARAINLCGKWNGINDGFRSLALRFQQLTMSAFIRLYRNRISVPVPFRTATHISSRGHSSDFTRHMTTIPDEVGPLIAQVKKYYDRDLNSKEVDKIGGVDVLRKLIGKTVVVFDGHCVMCDNTVMQLLSADTKNRMLFCPNQDTRSKYLIQALGRLGDNSATPVGWFDSHKQDSMIIVRPNGELLIESDAAIAIGKAIGGWHYMHLLAITVQILIPRVVRDAMYRVVARNRYAVFGQASECRVISPKERDHYL